MSEAHETQQEKAVGSAVQKSCAASAIMLLDMLNLLISEDSRSMQHEERGQNVQVGKPDQLLHSAANYVYLCRRKNAKKAPANNVVICSC